MEQPVPVSWLYAEARVAPLFTALASFLVLLQLIWDFEPQPLHRVVPADRGRRGRQRRGRIGEERKQQRAPLRGPKWGGRTESAVLPAVYGP